MYPWPCGNSSVIYLRKSKVETQVRNSGRVYGCRSTKTELHINSLRPPPPRQISKLGVSDVIASIAFAKSNVVPQKACTLPGRNPAHYCGAL